MNIALLYQDLEVFYKEVALPALENTLKEINKKQGNIYKDGNLTDYGKLLAKVIAPDIMKYAVINKLGGNGLVEIIDNKITYNDELISRLNLQGIIQQGYNFEAAKNKVVNLLNSKERNVNSDIIKAFAEKYGQIDENKFKLATIIAFSLVSPGAWHP